MSTLPAEPEPSLRPTDGRVGWALAVGGAVLLALVLATELWVWVNLWPITATWGEALLWSVPQLYVWALLIPLVIWLGRKLPVDGGARLPRVATHLLASAAFAAVSLTLVDLSDDLLHWTRLLGAPSWLVADFRYTVVHLHFGIAVYWVTLGTGHAVRFYRQFRERAAMAALLETRLTQAQLDTLRAQLQPHFLFNTLNSIAVLIRQEPAAAERMLHRLGDLLRMTLDRGEHPLIALEDELEFVRRYLDIETTRFHDRLTVTYDIDDAVRDAAVPSLLLQPLVENALKHAVAVRTRPTHIAIGAARNGDRLELTVRDDGPGLPSGGADRSGVGLTNTRQRLGAQYGSDHDLRLEQPPGGGLTVRIRLPLIRLAPPPALDLPADAAHAHR